MGDVLGADFMGVGVLGVDFTALIPWENGSQQGKKRMFSSPTLSNIYIDWTMSDALEEHDGKISIYRRNIINLQFAEGIDAIAEEEQE